MIDLDMIILNELTSYTNNAITIAVYGPGVTIRNFVQDPYFKVYNGPKNKATKVTRLYFKRPEYVYPEHKEAGKEPWYFNTREKKYFYKIISQPNVWGKLIVNLNELTGLNEWYDLPNYLNLERNNNGKI